MKTDETQNESRIGAPVRALILDFGEVLTFPQPGDFASETARLAGVEEGSLIDGYWRHRREYDLGAYSARDFWSRVLDSCGSPLSPGRDGHEILAGLIAADVTSWINYREPMWDLARAFREERGRTAILSNAIPEIISRVRADRPLERWFDVVVASCELGVVKPSPEIYQVCLENLGARPEEALFVDDRLENIEAAAALGLQTIQFLGEESVAAVRKRLDL